MNTESSRVVNLLIEAGNLCWIATVALLLAGICLHGLIPFGVFVALGPLTFGIVIVAATFFNWRADQSDTSVVKLLIYTNVNVAIFPVFGLVVTIGRYNSQRRSKTTKE